MRAPKQSMPLRLILSLFLNVVFLVARTAAERRSPVPSAGRPSLIRVDPIKILHVMSRKGGLVLPRNVRDELRDLRRFCRCDEAYLDVIRRELELRNFTVAVPTRSDDLPSKKRFGRSSSVPSPSPRNLPSLRVKRFFLKWDSYHKPCLEIVVEDVDILVEFVNLFLTRTNWNELKDEGFPPTMEVPADSAAQNQDEPNTFVRIGTLNLLGCVRLFARSRPLDDFIFPEIVLDLSTLDDLMDHISGASEEAEAETGRRGCTPDELSDILGKYFKYRVRSLLNSTVADLKRHRLNPDAYESRTIEETKRLIAGAKGVVAKYASDVRSVTEKKVEGGLAARLADLGLDKDRLRRAKSAWDAFAANGDSDEHPQQSWDEGNGDRAAGRDQVPNMEQIPRDPSRGRNSKWLFWT